MQENLQASEQQQKNVPIFLNVEDIENTIIETLSSLPGDVGLKIKQRYDYESTFSNGAKALVVDIAKNVVLANNLSEEEWEVFYSNLKNSNDIPSFYKDDDIVALAKVILKNEAIDSSNSGDNSTLSRIVLLWQLINIESLI